MMLPIPRRLLPFSMTFQQPKAGDYAGEYGEPVAIENVSFEEAENLINSGYVLSDGSAGVICIDNINSDNAQSIPVGSLVTINEATYNVVRCTPVRKTFGLIHHYEVEVK